VPPFVPSTSDILAAFAQDQIVCHLQPIVRIGDRRVMGVEALARLDHPTAGLLAPASFLSQVEAAGLGAQLMETVARHALRSLGARFFQDQRMFLAVNVPLDALVDPSTLGRMQATCRAAGMEPGAVVIELMEGLPVSDLGELADALHGWGRAGFPVVIDDAVPDTHNLARLLELPFSAIKLDRSVVQGSAQAPLQSMVEAAKRHGLWVVAEGVEDLPAWQRMARLGVDEVQGYLVAEPMPAVAVPSWLERWRADTG